MRYKVNQMEVNITTTFAIFNFFLIFGPSI